MSWQDVVLSIGTVVFVLALVPSIRGTDKPAIATSIINAVVLVSFGIVFISLTFWFTASMDFIAAILWALLAWQKARQP